MVVRVNKKQRKKNRQLARDYIAQAETIAATDPDGAATLGRIGDMFARLGSPPRSERHNIGLSTTVFKVLTKDSAGALFVMEHESRAKGGPPRHLHHNEDEWFYVIEGEYIAEIGSDRFQLKPGDALLAPRGVPHAWAFVGNAAGRLLISFAPANKIEAFFRDNAKRFSNGKYPGDAAFFRAYDCELLGPPLSIG